ncbi:MAG: preQ(1) synthase [Chthoniobacterales bacterium]|jgi:7-cyano-7-deazaguanine reductase
MPKKLSLLGRSEVRLPSKPDRKILETFPNRNSKRDFWITLDCPEFTSLCPVTGQPDFASLEIRYIADELCVETKSLKFYLASFRATPSFGEDVINRILDDLVAVLSPRRLCVEAQFAARGGISLCVDAEYPDLSE